MSVLTDAEGDCLDDMAQGLVSRYEQSRVQPPKVLYFDHDCCGIILSRCIFEWDQEDLDSLYTAKKAERLSAKGVKNPSTQAVRVAVGKKELANLGAPFFQKLPNLSKSNTGRWLVGDASHLFTQAWQDGFLEGI